MKKSRNVLLISSLLVHSAFSLGKIEVLNDGRVKIPRFIKLSELETSTLLGGKSEPGQIVDLAVEFLGVNESILDEMHNENNEVDFLYEFDSNSITIPMEDLASMPINDWTI